MQWRATSTAALLAAALVLLPCAAGAVPAPAPTTQPSSQPEEYLNVLNLPLLMPSNRTTDGRRWYFEVPRNPVGLLVMLHRCGRNAEDFWPPSTVCPQCIGMPESVSISRQALARGYALLAINSFNRTVGPRGRCWSWATDATPVQEITAYFRNQVDLNDKPLFFTGCSSGGSLALRLPGMMRIDGIMPVAIGLDMETFPPAATPPPKDPYPPVAYIHFARDAGTDQRVQAMLEYSANTSLPADEVLVPPAAIPPEYFAERDPMISVALSQRIHTALQQLSVLDAEGMLTEDWATEDGPAPWDQMLRTELGAMINASAADQLALKGDSILASAQEALEAAGEPTLTIQEVSAEQSAAADAAAAAEDDNPNFSDSDGVSPSSGSDDPYLSWAVLYQHVREAIEVAWAEHTNLGDYTAAVLTWLERCGKVNLDPLVRQLAVQQPASLSPLRSAPQTETLDMWRACSGGAAAPVPQGGNAPGGGDSPPGAQPGVIPVVITDNIDDGVDTSDGVVTFDSGVGNAARGRKLRAAVVVGAAAAAVAGLLPS